MPPARHCGRPVRNHEPAGNRPGERHTRCAPPAPARPGRDIAPERLAAYALELGSDCPFFLWNRPAFASGRGEQLIPVDLDLSAYSIQIVCPSIHVGTADAFRNIVPATAGFDLRELATLAPEAWRDRIVNDFEVPVFKLHPVLQTIKDQLYAGGAIYASMSGSGSSLYGLFPKGQRAVLELPMVFSEHYCA